MRLLQLAFLVALASGIAAILIYMTGVSNLDGPFHLSSDDLEELTSLQSHFQKCVSANGLGLRAERGSDGKTSYRYRTSIPVYTEIPLHTEIYRYTVHTKIQCGIPFIPKFF
ncbi:hypothetical protein ACS0TY_003270 [Phlomoides rotata]